MAVVDQPDGDLRVELRLVEEELARLRREVAEARQRIGGRWDAPTDSAEITAEITFAEEQEALIEILEGRRESLLHRLGERSASATDDE